MTKGALFSIFVHFLRASRVKIMNKLSFFLLLGRVSGLCIFLFAFLSSHLLVLGTLLRKIHSDSLIRLNHLITVICEALR